MTLRIRPGRPEDVEVMCDIYFSAFADNLVQQLVFPAASPESRSFWHDGLFSEMDDPSARFLVVVLGDQDGPSVPEDIIAFAKWMAPLPPDHAYPPPPDNWPSDGDAEFGAQFFAELATQHERMMGDRPHWYLECIGTRKEHQGKGAGAMLIKYGTARADEDGLECYLDSTPEGKTVYSKQGFRELKTLFFLGGDYAQCFMIRDAKHNGPSGR